jgi:filamentous hemagglutinin family protein
MAALTALTPAAFAQVSSALPTGGQVVAGQGTVQTQGSVMTVHQSSQRMAMDWQSFSIGAGQKVHFAQPNAQATALNRVLGSDVSTIQGQLSANGRVYLLNPNGILFTPTAQVDVGGLVASTLGMSNADFMAGQERLAGDSAQTVTNLGHIRAAQGGSVALVAAKVVNEGSIAAPSGSVALAAGRKVRVDLGGPALIEVEEGTFNALIEQSGSIRANAGQVYLTAKAASQLTGSVINQRGLIEAKSIDAQGGLVTLEADHILLQRGSHIDATGAQGGGTVLVGGDWQGTGPLRQAMTVTMEPGSVIDASAIGTGPGGKIVLWSDVHNPNAVTTAKGALLAAGGTNGGDGGRIETSGARLDTDGLQVDARAAIGGAGLWLLDPYDYTIDATAAGQIRTALESGTSVEINTANATSATGVTSIAGTGTVGNITVSAPISASTGNANLTLRGTADVNINENIAIRGNLLVTTGGSILLTGEKALTTQGGSVVLWANNTGQASNGYVALRSNFATAAGAKIETGGGHIWIGGGSGSTSWNGLTVGNGYAVSGTAIHFLSGSSTFGNPLPAGVLLQGSKLLSGGGNIYIAGLHTPGTYGAGIVSAGNVAINAAGGTIEVQARNQGVGVALGAGWHHLASNVAINGNLALTSTNSTLSAIAVNTDAAGATGDGGALVGLISLNATGGGGVTYNSLGSSTGSGLVLGYQSTHTGTLDILANAGNVTLNTGSRRIRLENSGSIVTLGFRGSSAVTASTSQLKLITNDLSASGAINFNTTGQVFVEPAAGSSFSSTVNTNQLIYSTGATGLTIGHSGNTGNVTIGSTTTIAGPVILYGGNLAINGTLTATNSTVTLNRTGSGTGTVTQTAAIVADSLLVSGGNVTLNHASNNIGTLAATGVGSLSYRDSNALILGTVAATAGISASSTVDVQTLTGNLTVSQNVSTSDTSSSAILLNAGSSTAAGSATGGDLLISGGAISTGTGGTARLMTGSVSGSTGLTALIGSGSGRFRYHSDETTTNYTTVLSSGLNGIYRERPSVAGGTLTMTYGDTLLTLSATGMVNGDTDAGVSIASRVNSTSGNIRANTYSLNSALGYAVTGSLAVSAKSISSIDGITARSKTYDGTDAATLVTSSAAFTGRIGSDALTVASGTGTFSDKNVANGKTVTITGLTLGGADAGNYNLTSATASTIADITARHLTLAIDNKGKLSGSSDPAWTYQIVSGSLVTGDALALSRAAGEAAGNYAVSATHPNYAITAAAAYLSITQPVGSNSTGQGTSSNPPAVNGLLTVAPAQVSAQVTQAPALAASLAPAIRPASASPPPATSSGLMLIPASREAVRALETNDSRVREPGKEATASRLLQAARSLGYTGLLVVEDGIRLPADIR